MSAVRLVVIFLVVALLTLSSPPVVAAPARAHTHDLGQTTLVQPQFAAGDRFASMPAALRGVVAVPDGSGPFPVALLLHGSYAFCTAPLEVGGVDPYPCPAEHDLRQFEGFTYLVEALAEHGHLVLVPDLSAEPNNGFAEPIFGDRAVQLVEAHIDALADGADFGVQVQGKADLERILLAGHSRGRPLALRSVSDTTWVSHQPLALALLTPAAAGPGSRVPDDLPTALVAATCDGDVGFEQPMAYLEAQLRPSRPDITTIVVLPGGTHNAFSTRLGPDRSADCTEAEVTPAVDQRAFAAAFLPRFFDLAIAATRRDR